MPTQLSLIGASGFIGLRCTELLHGKQPLEVIPVVRSFSSLAVVARQRLAWKIADPLKLDELAAALKGTEICVHAAIGNANQIPRMAEVAYHACAQAGVRRLIWLSSASVHGQNCPLGTTEKSELHTLHPLSYNNAKVRAERILARLATDKKVELVMLRPGVVFGARSRWITDCIDDLNTGSAAWLNQGAGICNSIYVDNLVEAIRLAAILPNAAGKTYLVGDEETVTWNDFLLPIAEMLGMDSNAFHEAVNTTVIPEKESRLTALTLHPAYGRITGACPDLFKRLAKAIVKAIPPRQMPPNAWTVREHARPTLSPEHILLQSCAYKFPHTCIAEELGYRAPIAFAEGMRRSLSWASVLAYPHLPKR